MAAKRYLEDQSNHQQNDEQQQSREKRARNNNNLSLASVIERVLVVNNMQIVAAAIEPMLRRVVCEEFEEGLRRRSIKLMKSPSLRLQQSSLRLVFSSPLSFPIFTDTKITTKDNSPLTILLQDTSNPTTTTLSLRIKLQLLVLDGDFPQTDSRYTSDEFNSKIVKERAGKRPLLAGEMNLTMKDGVVVVGELEFTDNSSWIRSRRFRIGVRVVPGSECGGMKIGEGFTDAFIVKDHRGTLYKKHHPPMLHDEVWRLEKIGKGGAFDKKLASEGINTVQDFLRSYVTSQAQLRKILGVNMSDKMWNVTINHAEKCVMDHKLYVYHTRNCSITFNPIGQVVNARIDGEFYRASDLHGVNKVLVERLAKTAHMNWDSLEVVEGGGLVINSGLLTQGQGHRENESPVPSGETGIVTVLTEHRYPQQRQSLTDQTLYSTGVSSASSFHGNIITQMGTSAVHNWFGNYEQFPAMSEIQVRNNAEESSLWTEDGLEQQMMMTTSELGLMRSDITETCFYKNVL